MKDFLNAIKSKLGPDPLTQKAAKVGWKGLTPEEQNALISSNMNFVMGMTGPAEKVPPIKLKMLSNADRDVMGAFTEMVEKNPRQVMGQVGQNAQRIVQGIKGIDPASGNKKVANFFNALLERADQMGIKPVQEPFIKRIDLK